MTGRVQRIFTRAVMLGYIELTCLKVRVRFVGKLLSPCPCCCHFICQLYSSLSNHSGDGRSLSYRPASSLTLEMKSFDSRETNRDRVLWTDPALLFSDDCHIGMATPREGGQPQRWRRCIDSTQSGCQLVDCCCGFAHHSFMAEIAPHPLVTSQKW